MGLVLEQQLVRSHYYGLAVVHVGERYMIGAACVPVADGFEIKVLVKSPVPKEETPAEVAELWQGWLGNVRDDYLEKAGEEAWRR